MQSFQFGQVSKSAMRLMACFLLVVFLSGCAQVMKFNPATGRDELIILPSETELMLGRNFHQEVVQKYSLSRDINAQNCVKRIGQRLSQVVERKDLKYKFYIVNDRDLNAFTGPGGSTYINSGLYNILHTDDQIAAVLSHELGHTAAKHVIKRLQAAIGYNILMAIAFNQADLSDNSKQIQYATGIAMSLITLGYSREDEYQADSLAVRYMKNSGYNPKAIIEVLQILERESKADTGMIWLRSHPYLSQRIQRLEYLIQQ